MARKEVEAIKRIRDICTIELYDGKKFKCGIARFEDNELIFYTNRGLEKQSWKYNDNETVSVNGEHVSSVLYSDIKNIL